MLKSDVDSSRYFKMIHYNIIVVYCTLPVFCVVVVGGVVVGVALIASNRCSSCHPILAPLRILSASHKQEAN